MNIISVSNQLVQIFQDENSSEEKIDEIIQLFKARVNKAKKEEVETALNLLFPLFYLKDIDRASLASLICGNLLEQGYSSKTLAAFFLKFYKELFTKAEPSLRFLKERIEIIKAENEDADEYELKEILGLERQEFYPEEIEAVNALEKFYRCGIAIFSSMPEEIPIAKKQLLGIFEYTELSEACYWFAELFSVLFNQPVLVINTVNNTGIVGEMSGIVDNVQLQLLLMGLRELKPKRRLRGMSLVVMSGKGEQTNNKSTTGLWNLNNYGILKHSINDININVNTRDYIKYWIWGEGKPSDIADFVGYKVIILSSPAYARILAIGRTFQALKAEITIKKTLNNSEISEWIQKFQSAP